MESDNQLFELILTLVDLAGERKRFDADEYCQLVFTQPGRTTLLISTVPAPLSTLKNRKYIRIRELEYVRNTTRISEIMTFTESGLPIYMKTESCEVRVISQNKWERSIINHQAKDKVLAEAEIWATHIRRSGYEQVARSQSELYTRLKRKSFRTHAGVIDVIAIKTQVNQGYILWTVFLDATTSGSLPVVPTSEPVNYTEHNSPQARDGLGLASSHSTLLHNNGYGTNPMTESAPDPVTKSSFCEHQIQLPKSLTSRGGIIWQLKQGMQYYPYFGRMTVGSPDSTLARHIEREASLPSGSIIHYCEICGIDPIEQFKIHIHGNRT